MKVFIFALSLASVAHAEQREEFAYGAPLKLDAGAAAYEATLTDDVYRRVVFADLRDLRVFNGDGEMVPYALKRPEQVDAVRKPLIDAPLFPLHGDADKALDSLRISIAADRATVQVRAPAKRNPSTQGPVVGYLIDLREVKEPIVALEAHWPESTPPFAIAVNISASDDLKAWRGIVSSAPLVHLQFAGKQLSERRIEFAPLAAKFLRIESIAKPIVATIRVEPQAARNELERVRVESVGVASGADFEFDLGMQAPIDRINVRLPQINSLASATLWSRSHDNVAWRTVTQAVFYRLQQENQEVVNSPLKIGANTDRYWRLSLERADALGSGVPRLQAAFAPSRLIFLARGKPPFTLAFGSNLAQPAASAFDAIIGRDADQIAPANASLGEVVVVGGVERLAQRPPQNWKNWTLWSVLIAGVALLGFMARRLLKEMNERA